MKKAFILYISLISLIFLVVSSSCSADLTPQTTGLSANQASQQVIEESAPAGNKSLATAEDNFSADPTSVETAAEALAENSPVHGDSSDIIWDSASENTIVLNGDTITTSSNSVIVEGSTATITSAGNYNISGTLADGQIIVDTKDEEPVRLILNGVDISSSKSAPIYINDAEEVVVILKENTDNRLSDTAAYVFTDPEVEEPNAALYSSADLTIYGSGSLAISGNFNDAIASQDGLIIDGGAITVEATDDGIRGKDYLVIKAGMITVNAQGDGLKSDNAEDLEKGFISVEGGTLVVTSGGDAITAETDVIVTGGEFSLTSGGGSSRQVDGASSAKGIKGAVSVNIDGGNFAIDSADDSVHSNGSVVINGGSFTIASADDGVHSDSSLEINSGSINITSSYEGLESAVITVNNGDIQIVSSDDGINIAGGVDSSGMGPGGAGRRDAFTASGNQILTINGGTILVDAGGDGLDVNGSITMTGGTLLVNGPTMQMNGALDYDGSFTMTRGYLVAAGSAGMAQAPGSVSSQNTVLIFFTNTQPGGTLVHIQGSSGEEILTFAPTKDFQSIAISSPALETGETYDIYTGGSSTGAQNYGLFSSGSYSPGTQYASFTVSSAITQVGSGGGRGGPGRRRP